MTSMSAETPAASSFGQALSVALAADSTSNSVDVEGANIHYRVWGDADSMESIVLVHGMLAHSHWWDAIAGWLSKDCRVVAIDLSGMGDSDRRQRYSRAQHAREIVAVVKHANVSEALLVAHSYGGDPAIRACREHPAMFSELILLDSRLNLPGVQSAVAAAGMGRLSCKVYADVTEAKGRFRLLPESAFVSAPLLEHVINTSIVECDGGWTWKYDGALSPEADPRDPLVTAGIKVPVMFVRGADSVVTTPEQMEVTRRHLPFAEVVEIPACGHHVMLDQPVALTALLRARLD